MFFPGHGADASSVAWFEQHVCTPEGFWVNQQETHECSPWSRPMDLAIWFAMVLQGLTIFGPTETAITEQRSRLPLKKTVPLLLNAEPGLFW